MKKIFLAILILIVFCIRGQNAFYEYTHIDLDTINQIEMNVEAMGANVEPSSQAHIFNFIVISVYKTAVLFLLILFLTLLFMKNTNYRKISLFYFVVVSVLLVEIIYSELSNYFSYGLFKFRTSYLAAKAMDDFSFFVTDYIFYPTALAISFMTSLVLHRSNR